MQIILAVIAMAGIIFYFFTSMKNNKVAEENLKVGSAFLINNKANSKVIETPSGLQYEILTKGTNVSHPKASDTVKVHYHGTLIDGTVFDSSVDRGEPISFPINHVIWGWIEGLQLMTVGDKFRFFIPSNLAYGNRSSGKIAAGSVLIFDVELLGISS